MNNLIIKPRATDYKLGDGHLKSVPLNDGNWKPYIDFFESQLIQSTDTDGCVLFSCQESFDAQINYLISQNLVPAQTMAFFEINGYMDSNSLDGKSHFHSSPRFLQILTGNGFNGNSVPDGWDVIRKYGCLPWTDLPVDMNLTAEEYLAPIPQELLNKAALFLAAIGGKSAISYQWICDGVENLQQMKQALLTAPLCLGVVTDNGWNQTYPTPPASGVDPNHCVMCYNIQGNDVSIYDHYNPAAKELVNYPVLYAFQGIVTITPPPPAPTLPPNPTVPQELNWITALKLWLQNVFGGKVGSSTNTIMSKTQWILVATFVVTAGNAVVPLIPVAYQAIVSSVLLLIAGYFHTSDVNNAVSGVRQTTPLA